MINERFVKLNLEVVPTGTLCSLNERSTVEYATFHLFCARRNAQHVVSSAFSTRTVPELFLLLGTGVGGMYLIINKWFSTKGGKGWWNITALKLTFWALGFAGSLLSLSQSPRHRKDTNSHTMQIDLFWWGKKAEHSG